MAYRIIALQYDSSVLNVDGFALDTGHQRIEINGNISRDPEDNLAVNLDEVRLLPIFETLEIDKAMIGGCATGRITASDLLTGSPRLLCPLLHVDSIGYNRCPIGNADITAKWDNERKGVYLDAAITGFEGRHSQIDGYIFPMGEALDINFAADSVPVAFLKPFMNAFASDITGRASGHCRLFGTFKGNRPRGRHLRRQRRPQNRFYEYHVPRQRQCASTPGPNTARQLSDTRPRGQYSTPERYGRPHLLQSPTFKFNITQAHNF